MNTLQLESVFPKFNRLLQSAPVLFLLLSFWTQVCFSQNGTDNEVRTQNYILRNDILVTPCDFSDGTTIKSGIAPAKSAYSNARDKLLLLREELKTRKTSFVQLIKILKDTKMNLKDQEAARDNLANNLKYSNLNLSSFLKIRPRSAEITTNISHLVESIKKDSSLMRALELKISDNQDQLRNISTDSIFTAENDMLGVEMQYNEAVVLESKARINLEYAEKQYAPIQIHIGKNYRFWRFVLVNQTLPNQNPAGKVIYFNEFVNKDHPDDNAKYLASVFNSADSMYEFSYNGEKSQVVINKRKYFIIAESDFNRSAEPYYSTEFRRRGGSWTAGVIALPIKLRPSNQSPSNYGHRSFSFSKDISLGLTAGYKWRISHFKNYYLNFLVSPIGLGNVTVDETNTVDSSVEHTSRNIAAWTSATGVVFDFNSFQFGLFTGWDMISASDNTAGWIYQGKPWFSIGVGFGTGIFNTNSSNGQSKASDDTQEADK